jgi:alpha-glucoside transport system substrate-binding protein
MKITCRTAFRGGLGVTLGLAIALSLGSASPAAAVERDPKLVEAAKQAALDAAGGKKLEGTLNIYGTHSGAEGEFVADMMSYFSQATGVEIKYTGSNDVNNLVQSQIAAGSPPDLYHVSGSGEVQEYAKKGLLMPLDDVLNMDAYRADFGQGLIDAVSRDGKVYGVWSTLDNFMIWYNPKTYTGPRNPKTWSELREWALKQAETGPAPWAMAGAPSWPMMPFIESMLLKNQGPEVVAKLARGEHKWSSPEVKEAFRQFGEFTVSDKTVDGGPQAVITTSPSDYGAGIFADPPTAMLMLWGEYAASNIRALYPDLKTPDDLDFFAVPGDNEAGRDTELLMGTPMIAFTDNEATRAFMRYWASPAVQSLIPASNVWIAANNKVGADLYKDPAIRKAADQFKAAKNQVVGPEGMAPFGVREAWKATITNFIQDPNTLDEGLAAIDAATDAARGQ